MLWSRSFTMSRGPRRLGVACLTLSAVCLHPCATPVPPLYASQTLSPHIVPQKYLDLSGPTPHCQIPYPKNMRKATNWKYLYISSAD